ncbi:hypothetical protein [Mucilaginibacter myungsuensis]|uniref:Uncharacterized protein n=1 Tax=Mucilaginibacter myungsuensis TaxID=649104 RepID=A0A929L1L0_9SPHI|nr:hypothetical protein [Mucilaginibacter myungsuensis]MBE9663938.1 hypothetical protein [Mucilaginibacter myungsuensis]MDN3598346.1 hypothetical protein [Mucilaginibacter myungsuensis]
MKKRSIVLILILTFSYIALYSQKLPTIQSKYLQAPKNVKIDGRPDEYEVLGAYNKFNRFYYAISNDDNALYLMVKVDDNKTMRKLVNGGITLRIAPEKASLKEAGAITFPKFLVHEKPLFMTFSYQPKILAENEGDQEQEAKRRSYIDLLGTRLKLIGLRNVKDVQDSVVSIYNDQGVKAAISFDRNLSCCLELALPLRLLNFDLRSEKSFQYQLQLNGLAVNGSDVRQAPRGDMLVYTRSDGMIQEIGQGSATLDLAYPTSFKGLIHLKK